MDRQKLLIADGTEDFRLALSEILQETYHVCSCQNGKEALALLRSFQPDVLVLDLMIPGLDGISLLQAASSEGICPMVLATTRFSNSYVLDSAYRLGVGYVMVKPCDIQATVARIGDLSQRLHPSASVPQDLKTTISNLLLSLGFPTKLRGYAYLREAIFLMSKRPGISITKELYPEVAAICGSEKSHVERSIRSAIEKAWQFHDDEIWGEFFPRAPDGSVPMPTNGTLIAQLSEFLTNHGRTTRVG